MVCYYIVNLASLLLVLVSAVSALPALPRHDIACPIVQLQSSGTGQIPSCSIYLAASTTQPLEQRREFLITRAIEGVSAKKQAKLDDRKERRIMRKRQKQAAIVAQAKQKQMRPPYGIDPDNGGLRKPKWNDVNKKTWEEMKEARKLKNARRERYRNLSPADMLKHNAESKKKHEEVQIKHKEENTKINNRQIRMATKKNIRNQQKAANVKYAKAARDAFYKTSGLPSRDASYASPQGKPYTGKDVRQAIFSYHLATAKGGVGYQAKTGAATLKQKNKLPKVFYNNYNKDPGRKTTQPLHNVVFDPKHPLKEFPILHNKGMGHDGRKPTPTGERIIIQGDPQMKGHHVLQGLVGHPHDSNDHVSF